MTLSKLLYSFSLALKYAFGHFANTFLRDVDTAVGRQGRSVIEVGQEPDAALMRDNIR